MCLHFATCGRIAIESETVWRPLCVYRESCLMHVCMMGDRSSISVCAAPRICFVSFRICVEKIMGVPCTFWYAENRTNDMKNAVHCSLHAWSSALGKSLKLCQIRAPSSESRLYRNFRGHFNAQSPTQRLETDRIRLGPCEALTRVLVSSLLGISFHGNVEKMWSACTRSTRCDRCYQFAELQLAELNSPNVQFV